MQKTFAKILKSLRKERGLKQKDVCEQLDITNASWSLYENNKGYPKVDKLVEIADYFDVSIDFLLGRTDNRYSHKQ